MPSGPVKNHLASPKRYAQVLYIRSGANYHDWKCLDKLWMQESRWNYKARNPGGAYGIPQALPAKKMAVEGEDWRTNYQTQVRWGLRYIKYHWNNDACGALKHSRRYNWY
jgi:membrane-bound lytic murein transglycosylase MltF